MYLYQLLYATQLLHIMFTKRTRQYTTNEHIYVLYMARGTVVKEEVRHQAKSGDRARTR